MQFFFVDYYPVGQFGTPIEATLSSTPAGTQHRSQPKNRFCHQLVANSWQNSILGSIFFVESHDICVLNGTKLVQGWFNEFAPKNCHIYFLVAKNRVFEANLKLFQ